MSVGTLYGVGLGPGDPELITIKAARLIEAAPVIAYHAARHGRSIARGVASPYLRAGQIEEPLIYPLTVETTEHPGGYSGALAEFYTASAAKLAAHLDAGRDVAVLCEGDPLFYGSYMHMHKRLADRYPTVVIPGVTSVSAAAAAVGRPLVEGEEILTILPGTLPASTLTEHLATPNPAAVLKLGRTFEKVRKCLEDAGRLNDAIYIERATWPASRTAPLSEVDPDTVPYFSLALLPSAHTPAHTPSSAHTPNPATTPHPAHTPSPAHTGFPQSNTYDKCETGASEAVEAGEDLADRFGRGNDSREASENRGGDDQPQLGGEVVVVGMGPGGRAWVTPEAQEALAGADELVGYGPYLARVPVNPRQRRHASDNRVEAERAAFALDLASRGARVAVVSSGDPGVFAMASAVFEAAQDPQWTDVRVRVVPGLTAAQAVASRVGAPLGHDYCTISLSDRLKPWEVIAERLTAAAEADFVIAIYNPASKSRRQQLHHAKKLLLEHRLPTTPVVIGRDVGGHEESIKITTLGELDPSAVDMRCLLIVGSSQTRAVGRSVFTPRHYPAS
jgi:precorrin-2 C20-methyltransferase/precorrin-3B C17-methyltransferase